MCTIDTVHNKQVNTMQYVKSIAPQSVQSLIPAGVRRWQCDLSEIVYLGNIEYECRRNLGDLQDTWFLNGEEATYGELCEAFGKCRLWLVDYNNPEARGGHGWRFQHLVNEKGHVVSSQEY